MKKEYKNWRIRSMLSKQYTLTSVLIQYKHTLSSEALPRQVSCSYILEIIEDGTILSVILLGQNFTDDELQAAAKKNGNTNWGDDDIVSALEAKLGTTIKVADATV